jgi:hypothetical protein
MRAAVGHLATETEHATGRTERRSPHPRFVVSRLRIDDNESMTNANATSLPNEATAPRPSQTPKMDIETVNDLRRRCSPVSAGGGGETIAANARRLGRSETAIRRAVRGQEWGARSYKEASVASVPARPAAGGPTKYSAEVVRDVIAARKAGEACSKIAARLGASERWVRWAAKGGREDVVSVADAEKNS